MTYTQEQRLLQLANEFNKMEQLQAALKNAPMASICGAIRDVCEILAEEIAK